MRPSRPVNRDKGCSPAQGKCDGVGMSVMVGEDLGTGISMPRDWWDSDSFG